VVWQCVRDAHGVPAGHTRPELGENAGRSGVRDTVWRPAPVSVGAVRGMQRSPKRLMCPYEAAPVRTGERQPPLPQTSPPPPPVSERPDRRCALRPDSNSGPTGPTGVHWGGGQPLVARKLPRRGPKDIARGSPASPPAARTEASGDRSDKTEPSRGASDSPAASPPRAYPNAPDAICGVPDRPAGEEEDLRRGESRNSLLGE